MMETILCKFFEFFFLCEGAKKILNSLQWKEEIAKESFTYENHLKVSIFCSPDSWIRILNTVSLIFIIGEIFLCSIQQPYLDPPMLSLVQEEPKLNCFIFLQDSAKLLCCLKASKLMNTVLDDVLKNVLRSHNSYALKPFDEIDYGSIENSIWNCKNYQSRIWNKFALTVCTLDHAWSLKTLKELSCVVTRFKFFPFF